MLPYKTLKLIIVSAIIAFLVNGCGAVRPGAPADGSQAAVKPGQQDVPGTVTLSPPPEESAIQQEALPQTTPPVSIPAPAEAAAPPEVKLYYADIEFVRFRLQEYEHKFENWLGISEMAQDGALAAELTALETECIQMLERILSGYSLLLERMQQSDTVPLDRIASVDPKQMQQLDIAFLESRCAELLAMDIAAEPEFRPETEPELSFAAAQAAVSAHVEQGAYQKALSAYGNLAREFPEQEPELSTRLSYGFALQYTGQVEEAAAHFLKILNSADLSLEPLSLRREIADLYLAGSNFAAAESYYNSIILAHAALGAEKTWAEEQLALLRTVDHDSAEMAAFINLLHEFQTYDYRIDAPRLNDSINAFALQYAGSPVALSALRLKTFAQYQVKSWFDRQLARIDYLVVEKKFAAATTILKNMTRYYLPTEMQATLQKIYYEVSLGEIQEKETQQRIHEMELLEKWDAATHLLDSQRYDLAITAYTDLMGTEYEEEAKIKIIEAANQAAGQMRKEAASLFIRAGKTPDLEKKKELLLASHGMLTEILAKYPQTDLLDKVQQNIAILEGQIQRLDPALLQELQQGKSAELPADPPAPGARQLQ